MNHAKNKTSCSAIAAAFLILLFLFLPNLSQAQIPENDLVCVEGPGAQAMNYGDNSSGCSISPASDLDRFTFQGTSGTTIRFNVRGASLAVDPRIEVRDPSGAVILDQFCSAPTTSTCSFSEDLNLTDSGTYQIAVSDSGVNNTGNYQISLNCLDGACSGAPALPTLAYDVPVSDALTPAVDMDIFTFQGTNGTSIRFNVRGASLAVDPRIEVRDPSGAVILDQFCSAPTTSTCSFTEDLNLTDSGTYQVSVSDTGVNNTGSYQISLSCLSGNCSGAPALPALAYDVPVSDALTPAVDMDIFTFQGTNGTSIRITVNGKSFGLDLRIEVRDPSGAVILDQFCSAPTTSTCSFSEDLNLTASGTYQLAVSDFGVDNTGNYMINISCIFGPCGLHGNRKPTANAGPDQNVFVPSVVQLDGSGSSDLDGDTLTFQWILITRPAGSAAVISDPNLVIPTFIADVAGTYVAQLVVNDGIEDSAADTVTIVARPNSLNDFNADSNSDLIFMHDSGVIANGFLINSVLQSFTQVTQIDPALGWSLNSTGDFNADNKADLLLYDSTGGGFRTVTLDGATVISDTVPFGLDPSSGLVPHGTGDFNGDGRDEIVVYDPATGLVVFIFLDATGAFSTFEFVTQVDVPGNWVLHRTGDYNGDGRTDLLLYNTATGATQFLEMFGSSVSNVVGLLALDPAAGWALEETGDFDGNGSSDMLFVLNGSLMAVITLESSAVSGFYIPGAVPADNVVINAGQYSADNKDDFLLFNTVTREVQTAIQDGSTITSTNSVLILPPGWTLDSGKP